MALLSKEIADAVAGDGLARVAVADDGTVHVLYFDGVVRSMEAKDWPPPLPSAPTPAQSAAAVAAQVQGAADAAALRQRVLQAAQSAVGIQVDALTAGQIRALVTLLLFKQGAIDKSGAVLPLTNWL